MPRVHSILLTCSAAYLSQLLWASGSVWMAAGSLKWSKPPVVGWVTVGCLCRSIFGAVTLLKACSFSTVLYVTWIQVICLHMGTNCFTVACLFCNEKRVSCTVYWVNKQVQPVLLGKTYKALWSQKCLNGMNRHCTRPVPQLTTYIDSTYGLWSLKKQIMLRQVVGLFKGMCLYAGPKLKPVGLPVGINGTGASTT